MLDIDTAIKHCLEVAEQKEHDRITTTGDYELDIAMKEGCIQCAADHRQLAEWLTELKERRAADVKRGYWKDIMMSEATGWDLSLTGGIDDVLETVCSVCGDCCAFGGDGEPYLSSYCPNCGADMQTE